jgi:hypothetical protein
MNRTASKIFTLSNLIAFILGLLIGVLLFFYSPLGRRYEILNDEGPGFYEVDTWYGDVRWCGPVFTANDSSLQCLSVE